MAYLVRYLKLKYPYGLLFIYFSCVEAVVKMFGKPKLTAKIFPLFSGLLQPINVKLKFSLYYIVSMKSSLQ